MLLDRREFQKKTTHQKLFLYVCEVKEWNSTRDLTDWPALCINPGFRRNSCIIHSSMTALRKKLSPQQWWKQSKRTVQYSQQALCRTKRANGRIEKKARISIHAHNLTQSRPYLWAGGSLGSESEPLLQKQHESLFWLEEWTLVSNVRLQSTNQSI